MLAATILTGVIQILFDIFKVAKVMKFIPRAVMIGFVNELAILLFMAKVPHFFSISTMTYIFVGVALAIGSILPRFFKAIPVPLIALVLLRAVAIVVYTHDLSSGLLTGVLLSAIFFVSKISKIKVEKCLLDATQYRVERQLFFASVKDFLDKFHFDMEGKKTSSISRMPIFGMIPASVPSTGLDAESQKLIDQLAIFKSSNAKLPTH